MVLVVNKIDPIRYREQWLMSIEKMGAYIGKISREGGN